MEAISALFDDTIDCQLQSSGNPMETMHSDSYHDYLIAACVLRFQNDLFPVLMIQLAIMLHINHLSRDHNERALAPGSAASASAATAAIAAVTLGRHQAP